MQRGRKSGYAPVEMTILFQHRISSFPGKVRGTADPSAAPDFLSRVAASVNCMWFSLKRTTYVVAGNSGEVGNPGTLGMTKRRGLLDGEGGDQKTGWLQGQGGWLLMRLPNNVPLFVIPSVAEGSAVLLPL